MSRSVWNPPELLTHEETNRAVMAAWINGAPASDAPFLKPEHFHDDRDKAMWKAILELEADGSRGDFAALINQLERTANLPYVNWWSYVTEIVAARNTPAAMSVEKNARTIYENWRRLQIYREAMHTATRAVNLSIPIPLDIDNEEKGQRKQVWTVAELLSAEFAEARGLWPGVIPLGLTVIGARPKHGKSLLMLQVSAAIGSGGMLFGKNVEQAPVLYYALEDSPRRLKDRLGRLDVPATAKIDFARDIKPLHLGGLADVEAEAKDYGLIIIDTISRAVPGQDFNREAALYGDLLGRLQTVALDCDMSIVTVVHTRKPNGMDNDPIDDVLGTTQMTAAADCVLAIYREGGRSTLKGRARDMEDIDLTMEFDPATICWQLVGPTMEVRQTESEKEILAALRELGRARVADVARAVDKDRSNTRKRLGSLWTSGRCKRDVVDGEAYYYVEEAGEQG